MRILRGAGHAPVFYSTKKKKKKILSSVTSMQFSPILPSPLTRHGWYVPTPKSVLYSPPLLLPLRIFRNFSAPRGYSHSGTLCASSIYYSNNLSPLLFGRLLYFKSTFDFFFFLIFHGYSTHYRVRELLDSKLFFTPGPIGFSVVIRLARYFLWHYRVKKKPGNTRDPVSRVIHDICINKTLFSLRWRLLAEDLIPLNTLQGFFSFPRQFLAVLPPSLT